MIKKHLYKCAECGEEKSILTQVSCTLELLYLCSDCYKSRYSEETRKEIENEDYVIPNFIKD